MTLQGHLHDDELTALHFRDLAEGEQEAARRHLEQCPACRARHDGIRQVFRLVDEQAVPEPAGDFEDRVWQRLEPHLAGRPRDVDRRDATVAKAWSRSSWSVPRWALAGGMAAALVLAFVAGRNWERPSAPAAPVPHAAAQAVDSLRERVLLTALGDHFDRSQRVMVELEQVAAGRDISGEQRRAADLLAATRIYQRAAQEAGDRNVADVLEALEHMLAEITMSPTTPSAFELKALQARMGRQELLFKLRVASQAIRGREEPGGPAARTSDPGV